MIETALKIAIEAHAGQVDKAGLPYILHPICVMMRMPRGNEDLAAVALLHDVLEDSDFDIEMLSEYGFSDTVLNAVAALTKPEEATYDEYINNICLNPVAMKVKLADLDHNMDMSRLKKPTAKDWKRFEKYRSAAEKISERLYGG